MSETRIGLGTIARAWGRIGCVGLGGPPTHIALLRELCVERRAWIDAEQFEDDVAATHLLPGPAATQLAILTAWRLRGTPGALVGGGCFLAPGLVAVLALSAFFLAATPPRWASGAAAGAGAVVAAVAVHAAWRLAPAGRRRVTGRAATRRWYAYLAAGALAAVLAGPWLVLVLAGAGLCEAGVAARTARLRGAVRRPVPDVDHGTAGPRAATGAAPDADTVPVGGAEGGAADARHRPDGVRPAAWAAWALLLAALAAAVAGGLAALLWVALKVGLLSYGGGFVVVPLIQSDVVDVHQWLTGEQFLHAVALGQLTPGPLVRTVVVVGYAAAGPLGGLLTALAVFGPSFPLVIHGGRYLERARRHRGVRAFLRGAGPAVVGAVAGSAVPLALALEFTWQYGLLAAAAVWLFAARRGVTSALVGAGALGVVIGVAGGPVG